MEIKGIAETILHDLRLRIISGELKPGQRLNEIQLASDFGTSRGPLREAFRLLENERLLINYPRRGTFVTTLSKDDLKSVYHAREMIECYALEILQENKAEDFLQEVSESNLIVDLPPGPTSTSEEKIHFLDTNARFHFALVKATKNLWLAKFYQTLGNTMARCQFRLVLEPEFAHCSSEDHRKLVDMVKIGAYKEGKELIKVHINRFVEYLLSHNPTTLEATDERMNSKKKSPSTNWERRLAI
jgi:DNA-binding GntR family transcriptional regulator